MQAECPHCGTVLPIKNPAILGKVRPCPNCGAKFRVEEAGGDEWDDAPPTRKKRSSSKRRAGSSAAKGKRKGGGSSELPVGLIIGGAVVAVIGLIAAGGLVWWMMSRGDDAGGIAGAGAGASTPAGAAVDASQTAQHLFQIQRAMHMHHDTHRQFPHPTHREGKESLSWRVHLLPYLDQKPLYDQFHLDEPWNSPHNITLLDKIPAVYQTRGVTKAGMTGMRIVSGHGTGELSQAHTMFMTDPSHRPWFAKAVDGVSNVFSVVECGPSEAIEWTKPEVVAFDSANPTSKFGEPTADNVWYVVMLDGKVFAIQKDADPKSVALAFLCNDGKYYMIEEIATYIPIER